MQTREWRLAVWRGRELVPFQGRIAWEEKRIVLSSPDFPFAAGGIYKAVFADPSYPYTLLRVYMRPLRIESWGEQSGIREVEFEYYHRMDGCAD